eukprot:Gb_01370 [translate_table: standard]
MATSIDLHLGNFTRICVRLVYLLGFLSLFSAAEKYRAVNLGGWLVIEGWIKPSLFDGIPNNDLLDGTQIQLKSVKHGTYFVAENGGGQQIAVNRANPSGWETFRIWRVKNGCYQLRVFNKQFIGADNGGGGVVKAVASKPDTWETFEIIRNHNNPNRVHIKVLNGMYMQAQSQDQLTADFQGEPDWDDNNAATFEMTIVGVMRGEYQLSNGYGPYRASKVLNDHRNTFITENDFDFLSKHGINAVRIPVGWWIASDPKPPAPFVRGSLKALDNAFSWAWNHGVKVIVDLHAAPGSQNGDEHSGSRDGYIEWDDQSQNNIQKSLSAIDFLAARYAGNPDLLGIELLNEPRAPAIPVETLRAYYTNGYKTVRKHSSTAYVVMCNRIGPADPKELFQINEGLSRTVIDVHYYNLFDDSTFKSKTVQQNIDFIYNDRASTLQRLNSQNGPLIFVGEWVSEWEVKDASQSDYQKFGKAQLEVYGNATFGWAYWTLKNNAKHWDFEWMVQNQYLQL